MNQVHAGRDCRRGCPRRPVGSLTPSLGRATTGDHRVYYWADLRLHEHAERAKEAFEALHDEWYRHRPAAGAVDAPNEEPVGARDRESHPVGKPDVCHIPRFGGAFLLWREPRAMISPQTPLSPAPEGFSFFRSMAQGKLSPGAQRFSLWNVSQHAVHQGETKCGPYLLFRQWLCSR